MAPVRRWCALLAGIALLCGGSAMRQAEAEKSVRTVGMRGRGDRRANAPKRVRPAPTTEAGARVAILGALPPLIGSTDVEAMRARLQKQGYPASILTPVQIADPNTLNVRRFEVLALPHAETFPAIALANLRTFLQARGKLLCVGGPAFSHVVYAEGAAWKTREDLLTSLPARPLVDLGSADLTAWARAAGDPVSRAALTRESSPHGPALHFQFQNFTAWDNFSPPAFKTSPFAPGATLTTFWARGGPNTHALVMEWKERDGSRWIGSVKLTGEWRHFALTPADFRYWNDSATRGRGGAGDAFHPENARKWHIGLAQSHASMQPGVHAFWLAAPGSASLSAEMSAAAPPVLEALSPGYKGFRFGAGTEGAWSPVVRERGIGFVGPRPGRLMPVNPAGGIESFRRHWVYLCQSGPMRSAVWGGIAESREPGHDRFAAVVPMLRRLTQGAYLVNGGAERACYWEDERVTLGARLVNIGAESRFLQIDIELSGGSASTLQSTVEQALVLRPGPTEAYAFSFGKLTPGLNVAKITLSTLEGGPDHRQEVIIDRIDAPFRVLARPMATPPETARVRVEKGEFVLEGKPWRPVGVNYWPLWVGGMAPERYHLAWLSPDQYDPELVERDLAQCEALGINLVSVQYTRPNEAPALDDFLERCRNHRLKADLFVSNADPLRYDLESLKKLVEAAHLQDIPTVFAFDVAWEPHVGSHVDRQRLDAEWQAWLQEQYGDVANAEADWGVPAPREAGQVTDPTDDQLAKDGPWRGMVAAYRRFLDDRISRGYRAVVRALRPYGALIGARSGYGGNGSLGAASVAPFDLLSGAAHLDFLSPEGYALRGDWPEFRGGGLTTAYARWAGNGKPVFWAEFGQSVYPDTDADKIAAQEALYDRFYRLLLDSGANGSSAWWFPGGLRIDENSDFGIVHPDGTARPAALRLRRHAARELPEAAVDPAPTDWITVDRDADARGYAGLYEKWRPTYARLRAEGKMPGVRTPGTGLTTASMPLVAVGNVPANGHNPLTYANAEISADPAFPGTVTLQNTGEAAWTQAGPGHVALRVTGGGQTVQRPLPGDVPRYGVVRFKTSDLEERLGVPWSELRLAIVGRPAGKTEDALLPFGERFAR
jgi:hypothetical protein